MSRKHRMLSQAIVRWELCKGIGTVASDLRTQSRGYISEYRRENIADFIIQTNPEINHLKPYATVRTVHDKNKNKPSS